LLLTESPCFWATDFSGVVIMVVGGAIRHQSEQHLLRDDTSDNSEDTIASRFEKQVEAVPDKLAIVTDETSLTYQALDLKASRIAAGLASLPSQRGRPVALFMKDEAARIAAMLGALKANAGKMADTSLRGIRNRADHC
jgi:non-ribosomal peptide synthetase component F